jgi:hypothetical protein
MQVLVSSTSSIGAEARQASVKHDDRTACLEHVRYSVYSLRELVDR